MRLQRNPPPGRGDETDFLFRDWLAEATHQHQPAVVGSGRTQNRADLRVSLCQREQEQVGAHGEPPLPAEGDFQHGLEFDRKGGVATRGRSRYLAQDPFDLSPQRLGVYEVAPAYAR